MFPGNVMLRVASPFLTVVRRTATGANGAGLGVVGCRSQPAIIRMDKTDSNFRVHRTYGSIFVHLWLNQNSVCIKLSICAGHTLLHVIVWIQRSRPAVSV